MSPEQERRLTELEFKVNQIISPDRYLFQRDIELFTGKHIRLGATKLNTVTPQAAAITPPSGSTTVTITATPQSFSLIDTQARTAINSLITAIKNLGITL